MKITCESCGAKYTIADDKVRGRKVKIRCKGCGTPIVVDGQASPGAAEAAGSDGDHPDSVEPSASPLSGASEYEWSVNLSDSEQLTLTTQQIVDRWLARQLTADAFVWREGMSDWQPILECSDLAPLLAEPARVAVGAEPQNVIAPRAENPSARPAARALQPQRTSSTSVRPAATAAARVTGGRAQGGHDLFAGVDRAGGDDEEVHSSAPALPQAGSARSPEEKATGARNENSVLFSLDALKAGFSGSGKSDAPAPIAAPEDPFGMGNAPALAGFGGGGTLSFSLSDNQNLLNAPLPPEPPAPRAAPAAYASGAPGGGSKKSLILFGGIGAGLLAVGLALGLGLSGGTEESKDKTDSGESALAKTEEKSGSDSKAEDKKEEPAAAAEETKPPEEEAKKDEEPAKEAEAPQEEATASAAAKTKASGNTSKVATTKAKATKEEPKPAGPLQPFNKGAAVTALSSAADSSASCKKIGGPTGTGKVQVTFAPSGRVTSATAGPPFAGTTVGGCIAGIFRKAKVPPFSGSALTVQKSVTIR